MLSERDRKIFAAAGWGHRAGYGQRPAIMVIDMNYNFCGDSREPIFESIKRWHFSCGERAWDGIEAIAKFCAWPARKRLPVIYTTNPRRADGFDLGIWASEGYARRRGSGRDRP